MSRIHRHLFVCLFFTTTSFLSAQGSLVDHTKNIRVKKLFIEEESSYLFQIDSKDYQWLGHIQVPQYGSAKVKIVEANIQDAHGNVIRKLKKSEISKRSLVSDIALFEDDEMREFRLIHNTYPYRVYYKTKTSYFGHISIARWSPMAFYSIPTRHASLTLELDSGYQATIYSTKDLDFTSTTSDGKETKTWTARDLSPIKEESFSPPAYETAPKVFITSHDFFYGTSGSAETWTTFGQWAYDLNNGLNDLPPEEKIRILSMTRNDSTVQQKIQTIYEYLQENHRYIFVAIDIGGHKSYPASYVVKNRYGDCKALTNYMRSALEVIGVDSYYTLVNAGDNAPRLLTEIPGNQFNHVILCVPMEKDTLWLENTSNWSPFGYLGSFTQNRYGLLCADEASQLVKIPELRPEDISTESKIEINAENHDKQSISIEYKLGEEHFSSLNYYTKNGSHADVEAYLKKNLIPFSNFTLESVEPIYRTGTKIVDGCTVTISAQKLCRKVGNTLAYSLPHSQLSLAERPDKRTQPIRINIPIQQLDSIVYQLPKAAGEVVSPENFSLETKFGSYSMQFFQLKDQIHASRKFFIKNGDYPLEDYEELYRFIQSIRRFEHNTYILIKH
ncbi:MAG: DUF3857 domain-containing protein [Cyclobacteriaceae bacterium]